MRGYAGATGTTVTDSALDAEQRRLINRRERFDAQKTLWAHSSLRRVAFCGRFASSEAGINVKASGSVADGTRRAGFGGLQSCGSTWSCSVCSEKIQAERQHEVAFAMAAWMRVRDTDGGVRGSDRSVLFLTLTMRHRRCGCSGWLSTLDERPEGIFHRDGCGSSLAALWADVAVAWNRTTSGAGVAWNGSGAKVKKRTIGDRERFGIGGYVRVVEVKHGKNGWHVHVHCLLFMRRTLSACERADLRGRLFGRWEAALGKLGRSVIEEYGIDLRPVSAGDGLADYFAKTVYQGTTAAAAAYEVTGSQSKRRGKGGRAPFDILRDIVANGDADDLDLWHEWETASKGRRQLVWSRGLRDEVGLNDEKTDEEIAAEDAGGDVLEWLHDDWRGSQLAWHKADLLAAAEADDTGETLCALLNRLHAARPPRHRE